MTRHERKEERRRRREERERRSKERWEAFFVLGTAIAISLVDVLVVRPFRALLRLRATERFKHLVLLRLDALCRELVDGRDLDPLNCAGAREDELRRIANHISERCAMGAVDQYPQLLEVFHHKLFWIYLNGHAVGLYQNGFCVGFYLGIGAALLGVWLL